MILYAIVHFKWSNIYVGVISYTYKSVFIFILTKDKSCAEKTTIYLDI